MSFANADWRVSQEKPNMAERSGNPLLSGRGAVKNLRVSEGISGLWHYHLNTEESPFKALCGASTMHTAIQLSGWGVPFGEHFPKRPTWCQKCADIGLGKNP